ncbi:MAG: aminotransferase class I/II-fold pyridoxal phosphate-dependent enzyme [Bacteroidaceae bacterium]|nr:aminotransferase class I/II-fold pyridoxal phosphate-dependent enzyme [Bacteroidaceae bacterium]
MQERIYLCLAHMSGQEMKFIKEAFDTNWVVPLGPNVNGFESDLEQFVGQDKKVAALASGTSAIHLALVQLGVKAGDEVICQSFTFAASANPVVYQGATPVFVDSERDSWNMDPNLLEDAIKDRIAKTGRKPKAIIPVYLYGMPAQIDAIMEIANRYEIPVIEDAAEGFGSRFKGQVCGTFGHFGIMSFNGNKMITTSGGGALICPDEETKRRILFYATQAREPFPYYQHEQIGYNYRMSNICAGIGRGQMTIVDEHIRHHQHVCQRYVELLKDVEGIDVHVNPTPDHDSNYWLNTITIDPKKTGTDYESVRQYLETKNIETRPLWKPMHLQPVYKDAPAYVNGTAESLFQVGLCLPSGPYVTDEHVALIVDEILACRR